MPLPCQLDVKRFKQCIIEEKRSNVLLFARGLAEARADNVLVKVLSAADRAPMCTAKCGTVFHGSPLAYQQPLAPHGLTVLLCKALKEAVNKSVPAGLPEETVLLTNSVQFVIPVHIEKKEKCIFKVH